jgi:mannose-6-phosphate isomerase-like protein (cupin superfamily)
MIRSWARGRDGAREPLQHLSYASPDASLLLAAAFVVRRDESAVVDRLAFFFMTPEATEPGTFDPGPYEAELQAAPSNLDVGTKLWFENRRLKVWEVRLEPGERGPFHAHTRNYFWTVVEGGRGLQRLADGTFRERDYEVGDTSYLEHGPDSVLIHDLENIGETVLRFVTVELHDG